jgi:hypothetical protein
MQETHRKEIKYLISPIQFHRIKSQLQTFLVSDSHMKNNAYRVRSLYFDSISDTDLQDSLSGNMEKCKIRLRWYPDSQPLYKLEYKCKSGEFSSKKYITLTREEAQSMIDRNYLFLLSKDNDLAKKLYSRMTLGGYQPRKIVEYTREAYGHWVNNTRITFDTKVVTTRYTGSFFEAFTTGIPLMSLEVGVLEVKFNGDLLDHFERIINRLGVQSSANSKYVQARLEGLI